jgi:hypothetical protein
MGMVSSKVLTIKWPGLTQYRISPSP